MTIMPACSCGQYRLHPDAQSCLELAYADAPSVPIGLYDGVIEVGIPDLVIAGHPAAGDECLCACHGVEDR